MRYDEQDAIRADERADIKARIESKLDALKEHEELQGETGMLAVALLEEHLLAVFVSEQEEE